MTTDAETLAELEAKAASAVAIEALWDGDSEGWMVDLYAVIRGQSGYEGRWLRTIRHGSDFRVFRGEVPPWPEASEAGRLGGQVAARLGVPFHFPSPERPEFDCPHWWQIAQSSPCRHCGLLLLQLPDCPWRGLCHHCHRAAERAAKEARWTPEERGAPRCSICGNPAVGEAGPVPQCQKCRDRYRPFLCSGCGTEGIVHRDHWRGDRCDLCLMDERLAALSAEDRQRLREAAARGPFAGLIAAREILKCALKEAQDALAALSRSPRV